VITLTWSPAFRTLLQAFKNEDRVMLFSGLSNHGFLGTDFWQKAVRNNPFLASSDIINEYENTPSFPGGELDAVEEKFGEILRSPNYQNAQFVGEEDNDDNFWYIEDPIGWYIPRFIFVPYSSTKIIQQSINYNLLKL